VTISQLTFPSMQKSLAEKIDQSIAELRTYQPEGEYYGCFSGGKDSVVVKELARMAGVRATWHYNVTGIDPPEVHRFVRRVHPDVAWIYNRKRHFFRMVVGNGYPTRTARKCCEEFKESHGHGQVMITGIRAAESPRRAKNWKPFTRWRSKKAAVASWILNPILYWSDADVWQFIHERGLPYCELYDEGFKRLGCIGCPMGGAKQVRREFARWPQYERAWRRSFHRLWARRRGDIITRGKRKGRQWPGFPTITTPDELFEWWVSGDSCPDKNDDIDDCQMGLF